MNLLSLTAVELGKKIKAGEVSAEEAARAALESIEAKEEKVHSFVTVDREGALQRAKEVQKKIDEGVLTGPLAGVPVAIKDNLCTKGHLVKLVEISVVVKRVFVMSSPPTKEK